MLPNSLVPEGCPVCMVEECRTNKVKVVLRLREWKVKKWCPKGTVLVPFFFEWRHNTRTQGMVLGLYYYVTGRFSDQLLREDAQSTLVRS